MVYEVLASDQACELGQHPGQSRTGDRRYGGDDVGRRGGERRAAHPGWFSCRLGPASWPVRPPRPHQPVSGRDLFGPSCGRPERGDHLYVRCGQAARDAFAPRQRRVIPAATITVVRGAAIAVDVAFTLALDFILAQAAGITVEIAVTQAVGISLALAYDVAYGLVIPLTIGLTPTGLADYPRVADSSPASVVQWAS
jgi:hypothetical protein